MATSSAHKVLDILLLFNPQTPEMTVETISRQTGIPTSSVYRYVRLLCDKGFLIKSGSNTYSLGRRFHEMSRAFLSTNRDLRLLALPSMKRIADQIMETVTLMRLFDKYASCIESIEGKQVVRVSIEQGRLQPLYAGASSKVLLAWMNEEEWDAYLDQPIKQLTSTTIIDLDQYKAELRKVRRQGYAVSDGEVDDGGRAVAVPIRVPSNKVLAALSIEGPYYRMTDDVIQKYLALLLEEAKHIQNQLLN